MRIRKTSLITFCLLFILGPHTTEGRLLRKRRVAPSNSQNTIKLVGKARNFYIYEDQGKAVEEGLLVRPGGFYELAKIIEPGYLASKPDDSTDLVVFTAFEPEGSNGRTYMGWGRTTEGLGKWVQPAPPDNTGGKLEGMVWMNDYRMYTNGGLAFFHSKKSIQDAIQESTGRGELWNYIESSWLMPYESFRGTLKEVNWFRLDYVFLHEYSHKYTGTFKFYDPNAHCDLVKYPACAPWSNGQTPNGISLDLLGVEFAHWNFYVSTGISPMEGMGWEPVEGGRFKAKQRTRYEYSDLDLYAMGLLAPEKVSSFFYIQNPHECRENGRAVDCWRGDRYSGTFMQPKNPKTLSVAGDAKWVTIDDILKIQGPRVPDHTQVSNTVPMSFVVIVREGQMLPDEEIARIEKMVDSMVAEYEKATRGLSRIDIK